MTCPSNKTLASIVVLALLVVLAYSDEDCKKMNFLPMPREITCGKNNVTLNNPCKILYHVKLKQENNEHVEELIAFQMRKTLHCKVFNVVFSPTLDMDVSNFPYKVEV